MTYRNPVPTVDVIVEMATAEGAPGVVLIRRRNPPLGWALPGGFVDEGERVEVAAIREVEEETGLIARLSRLLYVYSDPARDPRKHTLSVVFLGSADGVPVGADDAAEARVFALDALPDEMPFDHAEILKDYLHYVATGESPDPMRNTVSALSP